jgi:hypothetical protein
MIMMMRASSETLPAPNDGSVSSTFLTLRGLGCEARMSTSVSGVRNGGDGRLTWKTGGKRRPRGGGHGRASRVGALGLAVGSCPPWRRPPRSNGRVEDRPWQPTAEDGIYHQTHQSSKTDDLRATKRRLPLKSYRPATDWDNSHALGWTPRPLRVGKINAAPRNRFSCFS